MAGTSSRHWRVATGAALLGMCLGAMALTCTFAVAHSRRVRYCGEIGFEPQSQDGAFEIITVRTTCETARRVVRHSEAGRFRHGNPRYIALGFHCEGHRADFVKYLLRFRCHRHGQLVTFIRG
jgi:hypothetical protein